MLLDTAHKQWATRPSDERFQNLTTLQTKLKSRRTGSQDGRIDMRLVKAEVNGDIKLVGTNASARLNHWTSGQFLSKLGVDRELLAKLSPRVATDVLNDRLPKAIHNEDMPIRQRILLDKTDPSAITIRAFHGRRYERVWDLDVVDALIRYLPRGWKNPVAYEDGKWGDKLVPSGLYAGDRDMFAFLIDSGDATDLPSFEVDGEKFNRGFMTWNSEVGAKSFGFMTFMFDRVCGNHYVWGAKDVNIMQARHAGQAHHVLRGLTTFLQMQADGKLEDQRAAFSSAVRGAKASIAASVTRDREATLDGAYTKFNKHFTRTVISQALDAMLQEEKGVKGTRYDWLAGFTAVARRQTNADERFKIETKASDLLLATK